MPDQTNQPSKSLSEISHLFLSGIRDRQTSGAPRPMRLPPQAAAAAAPSHPVQPVRTDLTIDLSPEEYAEVFGDKDEADQSGPTVGPIRAVIASHLGPSQLSRVQEYASHICTPGKRIGLIAVDASEFRLSIFEHNPHPQASNLETHESEVMEPRRMGEALDELAWDVDQWLLMLPSPRAPEARSLLRDVRHWSLLMTCDHDGVVSCYRTLKGLSDLNRPVISLATLDASSDSEATNAFQRLSGVCRQFLEWPIESEANIAPAANVTEHVVLWCCASRDKAQLATAAQWQVVADFLARARKSPANASFERNTASAAKAAMPADSILFPQAKISEPAKIEPQIASMIGAAMPSTMPEVIDLPDDNASISSIVSAVLRGGHELVECPVKPPMCPEASLAVARDHRLVLVAVARQGLNDLKLIGRAYQWLIENRPLIAMAVPQMSIDAHQLPRLQLLVDQADMSAEVLQPILQSASVSVHAYRKLRWNGKTGLLLEAA